MGAAFRKLFGKKDMRILMLGLDAAGKTSILYTQWCVLYDYCAGQYGHLANYMLQYNVIDQFINWCRHQVHIVYMYYCIGSIASGKVGFNNLCVIKSWVHLLCGVICIFSGAVSLTVLQQSCIN